MGRAQARARVDDYLTVPKRGRPDLRVVEGGATPSFAAAVEAPERDLRALRPDWLPPDLEAPAEEAATPARSAARSRAVAEDLRRHAAAPAVAAPAIAEEAPEGGTPAGDAAADAAVSAAPEKPATRRTLVMNGRPAEQLPQPRAPRKRRSPTASRLAGRPDRVAGWAVLLGVVMAVMAGATAGSEPKTGEAAAPQPPALTR